MTKFSSVAPNDNEFFSFHENQGANGSLTGFDDFQGGYGCSDNWVPLQVRGERSILLVR